MNAQHSLRNPHELTPALDPTEDMTPEEYGAALVRWMDHGAPHPDFSRGCEDMVREGLIHFLNRSAA